MPTQYDREKQIAFCGDNPEVYTMINEVKARYEEYSEKSYEVRRKAPLFAGILGLGSDPRRHPCHEEFLDDMIARIDGYVKTAPAAEEVMEVASFMLAEPAEHREEDAYWFMFVAVGCIRTLVPLLKKEDCKVLVNKFDELYKKRDRMPVQTETYKMLVKASK